MLYLSSTSIDWVLEAKADREESRVKRWDGFPENRQDVEREGKRKAIPVVPRRVAVPIEAISLVVRGWLVPVGLPLPAVLPPVGVGVRPPVVVRVPAVRVSESEGFWRKREDGINGSSVSMGMTGHEHTPCDKLETRDLLVTFFGRRLTLLIGPVCLLGVRP